MTDGPLRTAIGPVFQLMYRSRDRLSAEERGDELADLFARARSNNERRNITGALLLSGQWFVQVLEGDEAVVRSLFATIQRDPRHDGVELHDSDIPLIAQISEIAPASSRQMTAPMKRLLDRMREAVDQGPTA
jgi:hypothetical protein